MVTFRTRRRLLRSSLGPLVVILILFVWTPVPVGATHVSPSEIQWACGFGRHRPENCGIEGIDKPTFDGPVWIDGDDRVIGLEIGGDARAYAVKQLDNHEIVNDVVGGTAVTVTWCPLCGSAVVYERVAMIDGERQFLEFDVSGFLYKHDLVMWDSATSTLWTQIEGRPIGTLVETDVSSDHVDATLTPVASSLTTWSAWRQEHRDSRLLDPIHGSYGGSYAGYESSCRFGISGQSECNVSGLHPKEQVFGISIGSEAVAYPVFGVLQDGGVVFDEIAGRGVVVATGPGASPRAFDAGGRVFDRSGSGWVDGDGDEWDLVSGARGDGLAELTPVDGVPLFWFAWQTHHPDTRLWLPQGGFDGRPTDGEAFIPTVGVAPLVALIGLALLAVRRRS